MRMIGSRVWRGAILLGLTLLVAAGIIATAPAPGAFACASPNGQHCYAQVVDSVGQNYGAYGNIYAGCLYLPNNSTHASVTDEMWDTSSDSAYWIEVGLTSGAAYNSSGYAYRNWFWADSRPGAGYHIHYPNVGSAGYGTYAVEIYYEGSNSWGVIGGNSSTLIGTSTNQPVSSTYNIVAGTEYMASSTSGIRDVGSVSGIEYQDTGSNWNYIGYGGSQENLGPGYYINGSYDGGSSTSSWSGPC